MQEIGVLRKDSCPDNNKGDAMARPRSDKSKHHRLDVRLNDEELDAVRYIADSLGLSLSGAVLDAVMFRKEVISRARQNAKKRG